MSTEDQRKILWLEYMLDTAITAYEERHDLLCEIYNAFALKLNQEEREGRTTPTPTEMAAVFSAEECTEMMKQIQLLCDNPLQLLPFEEMGDDDNNNVVVNPSTPSQSEVSSRPVSGGQGQRPSPGNSRPTSATPSQSQRSPASKAPSSQAKPNNNNKDKDKEKERKSDLQTASVASQGNSRRPSRPSSRQGYTQPADHQDPHIPRTPPPSLADENNLSLHSQQSHEGKMTPSITDTERERNTQAINDAFNDLPCESVNSGSAPYDGGVPIAKRCCHPPPKGSTDNNVRLNNANPENENRSRSGQRAIPQKDTNNNNKDNKDNNKGSKEPQPSSSASHRDPHASPQRSSQAPKDKTSNAPSQRSSRPADAPQEPNRHSRPSSRPNDSSPNSRPPSAPSIVKESRHTSDSRPASSTSSRPRAPAIPRTASLQRTFPGEKWREVAERRQFDVAEIFAEETGTALSIVNPHAIRITNISFGSIHFAVDVDHDGSRRTSQLQEAVNRYPYPKLMNLYEIEEEYLLAEQAYMNAEKRDADTISLNTEAVEQYNTNYENFVSGGPPRRKQTSAPLSAWPIPEEVQSQSQRSRHVDSHVRTAESSHRSNPEASSFPVVKPGEGKRGGHGHPSSRSGASQDRSHRSRSRPVGEDDTQSQRSSLPRRGRQSEEQSTRSSLPPRSRVVGEEQSQRQSNSRTPSQRAAVFDLVRTDSAARGGDDGLIESKARQDRQEDRTHQVGRAPSPGNELVTYEEEEPVELQPYDPEKYKLRTAPQRSGAGKSLESPAMEKALYHRRLSVHNEFHPLKQEVLPDLAEVEDFMQRENEELQQRKEEEAYNYRRTSFDAELYLNNKKRNSKAKEAGGYGNIAPGQAGALVTVDENNKLTLVNAKPPKKVMTGYELQLTQEKTQLMNQLEKLEFQYNMLTRRNKEGGCEPKYAQINHRIATVQRDLERVNHELDTIHEAERQYAKKLGSRKASPVR